MTRNGADVANVVRDTIYRATLLLDDQKWEQWLDLCDDSFHYAIKSFSPEINRDMTYFQGSRKDLATMTQAAAQAQYRSLAADGGILRSTPSMSPMMARPPLRSARSWSIRTCSTA